MTSEPEASSNNDPVVRLEELWRGVSMDAPEKELPNLVEVLSEIDSPGSRTDAVRLDAVERHKRNRPAGIAHYWKVVGEGAVAPGTDLSRLLIGLEIALVGRSVQNLLSELGPAYTADVHAAADAMLPSTVDRSGEQSSEHATRDEGATVSNFRIERRAGDLVGRYTLRKQIGRGGFGEVWLADSKDPFRRVAIKFLRPERVDRDSLARFQLERQALATLDHPGIAAIYDSGVQADGSPYAVMEFVQGDAISAYCDLNKLSVRERLDLFAQVCDSVHHAHQRGFIHRDLSPDNILVAMIDGRPQPKIIDFGIAKVADKNVRLTDATLTIDLRTLVGKPEYMAPEQAEASQIDIDTRADVFALGVILYELLTGVLPLPKEELRERAIDEVLRAVRSDRPEPSTRYFSLDQQTRANMSVRRGDLGPEELGRLLRGRIRHLPMKALRSDRTKRFSSAAAMGLDVRNYLHGMDFVEAAAEPWRDKAWRHARRHWAPYSAAALIAFSLIGGMIGTGWGYSEAISRLKESEAVQDFLNNDLLGSIDPNSSCGEVTVKALAQRAASRVGADTTPMPPRVEARVRHTLARVFNQLGEEDVGLPQAERAWILREHLPVARQSQAAIDLFDSLYREGRLNELPFKLSSLLADSRLSDADRKALRIRSANELKSGGDWDAALAIYREVCAEGGTDGADRVSDNQFDACHNIGVCLIEKARAQQKSNETSGASTGQAGVLLAEAVVALDRALSQRLARFGSVSLAAAETRYERAKALQLLGRTQEAIPEYLAIRDVISQCATRRNFRYAELLETLAFAYEQVGDDMSAIAVHVEAIKARTEKSGACSSETLSDWKYYLATLVRAGQRETAERELARAIATASEAKCTIAQQQLADLKSVFDVKPSSASPPPPEASQQPAADQHD